MIKHHPSEDEYFTAKELARILNIKVKSVYNRLSSKKPFPIPVYTVGGKIRFNKKDVEKLK